MANLFKGYVKSKAKVPIESVSSGKYRDVPPTDSDYCGILRPEYVQLDFDTEQDAELMMRIVTELKLKCDVLQTRKGKHFYFRIDDHIKNCGAGLVNAMGIPCDIGVALKNRAVPLRITYDVPHSTMTNGEEVISYTKEVYERKWIQTYDELDVVPCFFRPVGNNNPQFRTCNVRNSTLYAYILVLQRFNFTREETRSTIRMINKYMFPSPLPDKDIDIITRDDAFSSEMFYGEKGNFLHDRFGDYLLTNANILKIDKVMHIYNEDGMYTNNEEEFDRVMVEKISSLKSSQRSEVYQYMNLKCKKKGELANPKFIGFKDAILDIQTGEQFPYNPNFIMNNRINYDYKEDAYHELMDKTLDKVCCGDKQIRALLEEMIGYTLYRKNSMQVCFILTGEGSNGKSTILNCIKQLVGKANYKSLDLADLNTTFAPAELHNMLGNFGDDISAKYIESSSVFKKVVTGESFLVQRKYGQPFELVSYATQIFCANELPHVNDKSDGFARRIVIVPFNAKFSKYDADYDPFVEDKLMTDDAIQYLLKLAVDGLKRVLYNKMFTKSDKGEVEKTEYLISNNNVLEYFEEEPKILNETVADVYLAYQVWATKSGCTPVKKSNLGKEIKKKYGYESESRYVNGKSVRVYVEGIK